MCTIDKSKKIYKKIQSKLVLALSAKNISLYLLSLGLLSLLPSAFACASLAALNFLGSA